MNRGAITWFDGLLLALLVLGNLLALPLWWWLFSGVCRGGRLLLLGFVRVRPGARARTPTDIPAENR